jgi:hypothetical protein
MLGSFDFVLPYPSGLLVLLIVSENLGSFNYAEERKIMGEFLAFLFIGYIAYLFMFPNTDSRSYRLGRGVGNKTRKFGEWLTRDD